MSLLIYCWVWHSATTTKQEPNIWEILLPGVSTMGSQRHVTCHQFSRKGSLQTIYQNCQPMWLEQTINHDVITPQDLKTNT